MLMNGKLYLIPILNVGIMKWRNQKEIPIPKTEVEKNKSTIWALYLEGIVSPPTYDMLKMATLKFTPLLL